MKPSLANTLGFTLFAATSTLRVATTKNLAPEFAQKYNGLEVESSKPLYLN
jgi:hypothetical protein